MTWNILVHTVGYFQINTMLYHNFEVGFSTKYCYSTKRKKNTKTLNKCVNIKEIDRYQNLRRFSIGDISINCRL